MLLSIIVISKNEEKNIRRCLKSLFNNIKNIDFETILIDSNSSDNTVEIAKEFPCKILKVKSNIYTAALGRQIGLDMSVGEYAMFLDGDMEICPEWIEEGLNFLLKSSSSTLGVVGIRKDYIYKEGEIQKIISNTYGIEKTGKSPHFGGAIMVKANFLRKVGGYTISLTSNEEPELHSRILKQKYEIYEIPIPMIIHHTAYVKIKKKLLNLFNERNAGLAHGLKHSIKIKTSKYYFIRLKKILGPIFVDYITIMISIVCLLINTVHHVNYLSFFTFILLFQTVGLIFSGSIKRYITNKFLIIPFTLGLFKKNNLVNYNVIVLKK
jgi:glycosyltransferase involved in cell wall biosynthesis